MKVDRLERMTGGWFVGPFEPTAHHTEAVEVAVKAYSAGDAEAMHVHKLATEVTTIVSGRAEMAGRDLRAGDVMVLEPGEPSGFRALTDVVLVAVKTPAVPADKYPVGE